MKITIIGAGGLRTPLIVKSILSRQHKLGIHELTLMDIDADRLELIAALTQTIEKSPEIKFTINRTTDPDKALKGSNFVITTFRVGGTESRIVDERVPLNYGILGQETTGAGGFAMGARSIPVIIDYINLMKIHCPNAWLINFANPAGMLTEAVVRQTGWSRIAGICDAPSSMQRAIAARLGAKLEDISLDYFGLNHLGWIKRVIYHDQDHLPILISLIKSLGFVPSLPFDSEFVTSLKMLPNEYLYYYYYAQQAVKNIIKAGETRGEQITRLNINLFNDLRQKYNNHDYEGMNASYQAYLASRGDTYMLAETGLHFHPANPEIKNLLSNDDEGYAGVALDLIEGLLGDKPIIQILNIPNHGAINELGDLDVVEVPCIVGHNTIHPKKVTAIPSHLMGLIRQVKHFEHLTIEAALEGSYQKARMALTLHPLVKDYILAGKVLDDYIIQHKGYFPELH